MKVKGFTLLELLFTCVLLACISLVGIASYASLLKKNEQQVIIDELKAAVSYAKIQAIILGKTLFLESLTPSSDWSHGAVLKGLNKKSNGMQLLHQWQWYHPHWRVTWAGARVVNKIIFSNNPTHAFSNGRFTLINVDTNQQIVILLNRLGRVRVLTDYSFSPLGRRCRVATDEGMPQPTFFTTTCSKPVNFVLSCDS